ncbi:hypothetical protein MTO96_046189 [Rhipicephalus appendiculatus]
MASRRLPPTPPEEHCFTFNVPEDTVSIDEIIDSIEETSAMKGVNMSPTERLPQEFYQEDKAILSVVPQVGRPRAAAKTCERGH